jgi:hypothetical protein
MAIDGATKRAMAKLDTNLKLLIVIGVLGAGAAVKFLSGHKYSDTETVNAAAPLFSGWKKEQVAHLRVEGPDGKKADLAKDGEHWKVVSEAGGKADQALVDKLLGAIEKLKQGREASSDGKGVDYGVEGPKSIHVTAWGGEGTTGKPMAQFALGKIENDWKNSFLRLPGESRIRKVEASASDFGPTSGDSWRDKSIYSHGETDKVAQVEITGPNGAIVLKREKVMGEKAPAPEGTSPAPEGDAAAGSADLEVKETVWNVIAPKEGRAKKWLCDSIAGYVAKLECSAFHAGTEKAADLGLDPPQYVVRAQFEGDAESREILRVGNKNNEGKFACMAPGSDQLFWIEGWKGDYLTKSVDDLLDAPPAKPADTAAGDGGATPDATAIPANESASGDAATQGDSGDAANQGAAGDALKSDAGTSDGAAPVQGDGTSAPSTGDGKVDPATDESAKDESAKDESVKDESVKDDAPAGG